MDWTAKTCSDRPPGFSRTLGRVKDRTRQYFPLAADQAEFRAHCREFADLTRLAVATLWTDAIADLATITLPTKRDYCSARNLPYVERHGRIHKDRPAAWSKLPLLLSELPRFGWIFWSDADALFMRRDVDLRDFLDDEADLIWTEDESGPNTGNFFIRHCPASMNLLQRADALFGQTSPEDRRGRFRGQWEQAAIREVIEAGNAPALRVKVIPKRSINSYDTDYEPGDFILHLTGLLKMERLAKFGSFAPDQSILQSIPEIKTAVRLRPNLWLGGEERAKDADWLCSHGITAILNVAKECTDPDCGVARFSEPLEDVEGNTPAMIEAAKSALRRLLDAGEVVYLHCVWGLNRSVYIASHILAAREGITFDEAFACIKAIRGPNVKDRLRGLYG